MVDGIRKLTDSAVEGPTNIRSPEYVTVKELVDALANMAGKHVRIKWVHGPVGVQSRNFSTAKIYSVGWRPRFSLQEGISMTYPWIEKQVQASRDAAATANRSASRA